MTTLNQELDLVLERTADVSPESIWKCWTEPESLMPWFCPRPWKVTECRIDLKPGGEFFTVMQGPDGKKFPNTGCFLEIIPNRKLVWTSALLAGYRPLAKPENGAGMPFTCIIQLEPQGQGTRYTAIAMHPSAADRTRHEQMGFHDGWGTAFKQMIELIKTKEASA